MRCDGKSVGLGKSIREMMSRKTKPLTNLSLAENRFCLMCSTPHPICENLCNLWLVLIPSVKSVARHVDIALDRHVNFVQGFGLWPDRSSGNFKNINYAGNGSRGKRTQCSRLGREET